MNEPVTMKGIQAHAELFEGDTILVSITHEVKIGRESSWVKYEANSKVRPDEAAQDARTRVINHVNQSVMVAVEEAVNTVRSYK